MIGSKAETTGPWRRQNAIMSEFSSTKRVNVSVENRRASTWIEDHIRVGIVAMEDRDFLECIEHAVLDTLDPPFNLNGRVPTVLRRHLAELRRAIEK